MKKSNVIFCLLGVLLLAGCSDRSAEERRCSENTNCVSYLELKTNDILVVVNGISLTKDIVEEQIQLDIAFFRHRQSIISKIQDDGLKVRLASSFRNRFITKALLLSAADQLGVVADSNAIVRAWQDLEAGYGREGETNSCQRLSAQWRPRRRLLLDANIREAAKIYRYLDEVSKGKVFVTEDEIDRVEKHGRELEARSKRLLAEQWEKARKIHERLKNGEDFVALAAMSDTVEEDEGVGNWGDFTPRALEGIYPGMAKKLASLAVGQFTEPLEMEDAIHIIRVKERAGKGEESVVAIDPEHMVLQRIVVRLPILYSPGTREQIRRGLLKEKLAKFQKEELLPSLKAKAVISYPNGKIDFKVKEKRK